LEAINIEFILRRDFEQNSCQNYLAKRRLLIYT